MSLNSKRKFRVITTVPTGNGIAVEDFEVTLNDLIEEGNETAYALQEMIDDVMDIPEGCSMYFRPNRDEIGSKAIIIRIK